MADMIPETAESLSRYWDLDPDVTYMNHGSFGPSPRPVIDAVQAWTQRLERQPMRFFCQQAEELLEETAANLARWLKTKPNRIVPIDNATLAMNVVACSTRLQAADEVLLTDHEYGAVRNIWNQRCRVAGAQVVTVKLPFPPTAEKVVAAISDAITPRTRMIIASHVTSATACVLPIADICRIGKQHRIPVCVDGPHAIAMLDVSLDELGCDFYCASGHKWLCAPFGSGFLWVHPRHQSSIRSPVVSWGGSIAGRPGSWKDALHWLGTRDPSPLLAVSSALQFFEPDVLATFRAHAHELVTHTRQRLLQFDGVSEFCTPTENDYVSMGAVELPRPERWKPGYHGQPDPLQIELRDRFQIEIPVGCWNGHRFLRVSAHLYNTLNDVEHLVSSLQSAKSLYA
jgi:isopenicillin-N epimerase